MEVLEVVLVLLYPLQSRVTPRDCLSHPSACTLSSRFPFSRFFPLFSILARLDYLFPLTFFLVTLLNKNDAPT